MSKTGSKLTKRQQTFLGRLAQAREGLLAVIDGLDEETLCTVPITGDWTIKDILGHLVSWNEEFQSNIAAILAGYHPGYDHQISEEDDFNDSNQDWIAGKRGWSYERIWADIDRDYEGAVALILWLKPIDYRRRGVTPWKQAATQRPAAPDKADTDSIQTLVTFHWRHMNMHVRELEAWRKGMRKGEAKSE